MRAERPRVQTLPNGFRGNAMLDYRVSARRVDSRQPGDDQERYDTLDTDVSGRPDAFNPAELFLAAIAASMIKGIDRVTPMLKF
jgi:hypothetical protein